MVMLLPWCAWEGSHGMSRQREDLAALTMELQAPCVWF